MSCFFETQCINERVLDAGAFERRRSTAADGTEVVPHAGFCWYASAH